MEIREALKRIREHKPRKFTQTIELIVTLRNIDLRKPENRIVKEVVLPYGRGKKAKVCLLSRRSGYTKERLENMNKKELKRLAKEYEFFLADAELMPVVGKVLGKYLASKGKMPTPIPPTLSEEEIKDMIAKKEKSVRVKIRTQPQVQVPVGTEEMKDEEIEANVKSFLRELLATLPKGRSQIGSIYLKGTMTPAFKVEVRL